MATPLHKTLLSLPLTVRPPSRSAVISIRCGSGPRSNRGALVKGRILSTEAIHAIQSLKRNKTAPNLSRLLKPDLLSILKELLRQDQCSLALHVLTVLRAEFPDHTVDLNLYADFINTLVRRGERESVERVVEEMESDRGVRWGEDKGLTRVVKAVVGSGKRDLMARIWRVMRREGCGETWTVDEYVGRALCRGVIGVGDVELSEEVRRVVRL